MSTPTWKEKGKEPMRDDSSLLSQSEDCPSLWAPRSYQGFQPFTWKSSKQKHQAAWSSSHQSRKGLPVDCSQGSCWRTDWLTPPQFFTLLQYTIISQEKKPPESYPINIKYPLILFMKVVVLSKSGHFQTNCNHPSMFLLIQVAKQLVILIICRINFATLSTNPFLYSTVCFPPVHPSKRNVYTTIIFEQDKSRTNSALALLQAFAFKGHTVDQQKLKKALKTWKAEESQLVGKHT